VGPALRTSACVWLSAAVLAVSARADVCPCSAGVVSGDFSPAATLLRPAANADATYHVEQLGDKGVKLISNNLENNYALTLSGSNSDADTGLEALAPGEAWHKSLGVELEGKVGALLNTDFRTNFTEVERNSSAELFGLQSLDASADNRRALEEFDATTKFMGDRVTFTSSRRTSSLVPLGAGADDSKGTSEQDRFSAYLWQSDQSSLSVDGALSRIDADYQDLTNTNTTDALQARNKETHQLRSKLSIGWAGFFVSHRDAVTLIPDQHGAQPQQSEIETGISVGLSALRDTASGEIGHDLLSVLPDSLWISTDHGSVAYGGFASTAGQTEKSAIGMTRNWNTGAIDLSYWQSAVQTAAQLPDDVQWRGHGMDATGNLYSGRWSLSGNLSWYKANDFALSNNSNENSVNGSLFVNWQPALGPKLSAGVTNYAYAADFLDYNGVQKNSLMRYQLAVDGSQLLVTALSDRNTHLTFLASYQGNKSRSQWSQADYSNDMGNVFVGFRFTRPFLP
jgi:hypothetical protein